MERQFAMDLVCSFFLPPTHSFSVCLLFFFFFYASVFVIPFFLLYFSTFIRAGCCRRCHRTINLNVSLKRFALFCLFWKSKTPFGSSCSIACIFNYTSLTFSIGFSSSRIIKKTGCGGGVVGTEREMSSFGRRHDGCGCAPLFFSPPVLTILFGVPFLSRLLSMQSSFFSLFFFIIGSAGKINLKQRSMAFIFLLL